MHVKIIRNTIATPRYSGKKGDIIEVPDAVGKSWIEAKAAAEVSADEAAGTKQASGTKGK